MFVSVHTALRHGFLLLDDDLLGALRHPLEMFAVVFLALEADVPTIPHDQQAVVGHTHLLENKS